MASKLEHKIQLQLQRLHYLEQLTLQLTPEKLESMSLPSVNNQLEVLERKWEQVDMLHNSLYDGKSEVLDTKYHTDNVYQSIQMYYVDLRALLLERKEALMAARTPSGQELFNNSSVGASSSNCGHKLPEIKLPTFSGDPLEWVTFRDLFLAVVGNDSNLDPATKMYYLKTQLTGEAKDLLASLPPTSKTFQPAWDLLVRRFDNPRILIRKHAEKLLFGPRVTEGSATELKELLASNTKALDALKALGTPVNYSDVLLVTATLSKLSSSTIARWETKLGLSKEFPSYEKLLEFLEITAIVWESSARSSDESPSTSHPSSSKSSTSKPSTSKPSTGKMSTSAALAKVFQDALEEELAASSTSRKKPAVSYTATASSGTPVENTDAPNECAMCRQKHFILWCPKFRVLAVDDKVRTVKERRLCFNCLGRHRVQDCTSEKRCQKCGAMHHTEIHFEDRAKAREQRRASQRSERVLRSPRSTSKREIELSNNESDQLIAEPSEPALSTAKSNLLKAASKRSKLSTVRRNVPRPTSAFSSTIPETELSTALSKLLNADDHKREFSTSELKFCFISEPTEKELSNARSNLLHAVKPKSKPSSKSSEKALSIIERDLHTAVSPTRCSYAGSEHREKRKEIEKPSVLLATGRVLVIHPQREPVEARVLIDPGSELSFISEKFFKSLKVSKESSSIPLRGIGNSSGGVTKGVCLLKLQSRYSELSILTQTFIVSELTSQLPTENLKMASWPHLDGLDLADPAYKTSQPIDILLGAIPVSEIMLSGIIRGDSGTPIAQSTIFGWIAYGSAQMKVGGDISYCHHSTSDEELHSLISKFWAQEEISESTASQWSPEEQQCEDHFTRTHSRDETGRYIVRLPLRASPTLLGESSTKAKKCLSSVLRRLDANPEYGQLYSEFMTEYENLDHMRRAPAITTESPIYYLPHHGVLREQSTTTKLRVVFNGSSNTTSGTSLNDLLHIGPKIQPDLSDVLLWVRKHRVVFATDITKMFRQIKVHPEDWDLQRVMWIDNEKRIVPYQLTTVTYGTRSAPYLAVRVLLQLAEDEGEKFPLAVEPIIKGRYVDDIYGGGETVAEAISSATQLKSLCASGGFPLAKWASNSPEVLATINPESQSSKIEIQEKENSVKVLGLSWNPMTDQFQFKYSESPYSQATKRIVLSEIARLFDPLGFLVPVLVKAKMLMQELWLEKVGWDEPLSAELSTKWSKFRGDLSRVNIIDIPRWLHLSSSSAIEIHGFSDASQLAMAAVVFLKITNESGECSSTIVCAKSQVAPLKPTTIPRLELNAAVLLTKLVSYVKRTLEITDVPTHLWTDSSVTRTWIKSPPSRWKDYVRNRVHRVQELQPNAIWHYVAGKQNPADCASRGLSPEKLRDHTLWWHGPSWLLKSSDEWPTFKLPSILSVNLEERPGQCFSVRKSEENPFCELLEKRSRLLPILRITATCLRAVLCFKRKPQSSLTTPLSTSDLEAAKLVLIKTTQGLLFSEELSLLRRDNVLPSSNHLCKLTPFIDREGVLRVGGRLEHAEITSEEKHQAILPRSSPLTSLVIADAHERTLHGGTQLTLAYLRRTYWIVGGRVPVRSHILRCVTCTRNRGVRAQQLMGQLPSARVNPSRAFLHCGLDYAGPFTVKTWKGRGAKTQKSWIAVFVCLFSSAVHLEVVTDYSTETFIAAYRRFISRRGICTTLYSDCGTNFLGADKILRDLFQAGTSENEHLRELLLKDGTNWQFNPPSAPHFGGKWEAAVKSLKFHLRRVIGETLLTYEELSTLLTQIESVLNSRPLSPLSEDPSDLRALTPGHFLIGEPLNTLPEPSLLEFSESRLSKWQLIQQKLQYFWKRWSAECMQRYQAISKWHHPSNEIKVGSMVLLTDERFPPSKWPLARVEKLHPGADGLTRVVTIRTATTTLTRPISKLCVLPTSTEKEEKKEVDNQVANGGEDVQSTD